MTTLATGQVKVATIGLGHVGLPLAVFAAMGETRLRALLVPGGLPYDLKEALPISDSDARL